jgi:putative membrane protein
MIRLLLAALHLLALGVGLGAVWARSRALRGDVQPGDIRRALVADTWWGIAAALWLVTGVWRLFGETEKPTGYYLSNHIFLLKMGLFVAILLLELGPMAALMRWRRELARGGTPPLAGARRISTVSAIEAALVVGMVGAAVTMARGFGAN